MPVLKVTLTGGKWQKQRARGWCPTTSELQEIAMKKIIIACKCGFQSVFLRQPKNAICAKCGERIQ